MVTSTLVVAGCVIPDGPSAMVDGNCLDWAIRSVLKAHTGTISCKAKFKLTHLPILKNLVQTSFLGYQ